MNNNQINCQNCNANNSISALFCNSCNSILPPADIDYFTLFGIKKSYEIGEKNLSVAYFGLQNKLHPDRFIKKSEREKTLAMQQSVKVNEAYDVLLNPLSRAEYMLKLNGFIVNRDGEGVKPSQDILVESMEDREELMAADNMDAIRKIQVKSAEKRINIIESVKKFLHEELYEKAAQETIRLKYIEKLIDEVRKKNI